MGRSSTRLTFLQPICLCRSMTIVGKSTRRLKSISTCCHMRRYDMSIVIAAILRWLQYTTRRAVLVVSRDGFILWSRRATPRGNQGHFSGPLKGLLKCRRLRLLPKDLLIDGQAGINMAPGTWLREEIREMTVFADQYEFVVTLLSLSNDIQYQQFDAEPGQDTYERFIARR